MQTAVTEALKEYLARRKQVRVLDLLGTITVTTPKTVDDARAFYVGQLTADGWTAAPQGRGGMVPNLPVAIVNFTKGPMALTATITATPEGTRINLSALEP